MSDSNQVKIEALKLLGTLTISLLTEVSELPVESIDADILKELRENVKLLVGNL